MRGMVGAESTPMAVIRKRVMVAPAILQGDIPASRFLTVVRGADAAAELDIAAQVELVGDVVQIALGFGLRREVFGPVPFLQQLLGKRVAVGPAFGIEARARVAVPVPGAADIGAVLEHQRLQAEFAQLVELVEAGNTGADDDRVKIEAASVSVLCASACEVTMLSSPKPRSSISGADNGLQLSRGSATSAIETPLCDLLRSPICFAGVGSARQKPTCGHSEVDI